MKFIVAAIISLLSSVCCYAQTPGCDVLGGWPGAQYGLTGQLIRDAIPCYGITGTRDTPIVLQDTPSLTTPNFTGGFFRVDGNLFGTHSTNYNQLTDIAGTNGIQIGNNTDPTTYHSNGVHAFRSKNTAVPFLNISSAGVTFFGATSGTPIVAPQAIAGSPALVLPNTSGTLTASCASPLACNATTGQISLTGIVPTANGGTGITACSDVGSSIIDCALSVQVNGDTNDCASGAGSFRAYNLTYALPANFLVTNRAIQVFTHFRVTTGTVPTGLEIQLKVGGTVVAHYGPNTPTAGVTNIQSGNSWILQATAAPGASVNTETVMMGNANGIGGVTVQSDTAQPVALATNGSLTISVESKWAGACTGTNTFKLSQFIVRRMGTN